jgi:hypothetical protein
MLEGRRVSVALRNGSRIDDSQLVSSGRNQETAIWLFCNNVDVFVPWTEIVALWETDTGSFCAA